jgi:hypothetical protein
MGQNERPTQTSFLTDLSDGFAECTVELSDGSSFSASRPVIGGDKHAAQALAIEDAQAMARDHADADPDCSAASFDDLPAETIVAMAESYLNFEDLCYDGRPFMDMPTVDILRAGLAMELDEYMSEMGALEADFAVGIFDYAARERAWGQIRLEAPVSDEPDGWLRHARDRLPFVTSDQLFAVLPPLSLLEQRAVGAEFAEMLAAFADPTDIRSVALAAKIVEEAAKSAAATTGLGVEIVEAFLEEVEDYSDMFDKLLGFDEDPAPSESCALSEEADAGRTPCDRDWHRAMMEVVDSREEHVTSLDAVIVSARLRDGAHLIGSASTGGGDGSPGSDASVEAWMDCYANIQRHMESRSARAVGSDDAIPL